MNKIEPHRRHIVHREIHIELYYVAAYVPMFYVAERNCVLATYMPLKERVEEIPE